MQIYLNAVFCKYKCNENANLHFYKMDQFIKRISEINAINLCYNLE